MKVVVGIPARLGSSRLPGKPLAEIAGMPMIEHVYKRCSLSKYGANTFIATCDEEIKDVVEEFGGEVIMTDLDISRPGLRVADAAKTLDLDDNDIVVVVQGDEPFVHPEMIDLAIEPLLNEEGIFVSNMVSNIQTEEEWVDSNNVKVVTDLDRNAIYMSRCPIPSTDHEELRGERLLQVCILPFFWHFMKKFNELAPTPLEKAESIEMIRAIQHGYKVRMVETPYFSMGVDTPDDLLVAQEKMLVDAVWPLYKPKN